MRLFRVVHALRSSLWLIPLLCVLAGVLVAVGTLWLDRRSDYTLVPQSLTGTPSDVQTTLSIFATAMASLISLVLTVTLVVVQLAMGQFSPRIVGALLSDRFSQLAIGLFGATFVVAVLTLREIRGSDTGTVPGLSVLLSYLLMAASLVTLVLFVHHSGQSMRRRASSTWSATAPATSSSRPSPQRTGRRPVGYRRNRVPAPEPGTWSGSTARDWSPPPPRRLRPRAGARRRRLRPGWRAAVPRPPRSRPAPDVAAAATRLRADDVERLVVVGAERVHTEDAAYGLRKLVDVAERSIAQPFDDPDDDLAGGAPAARPAAPARRPAAPRGRAPGRHRRGPAGRADAVLGGLRAAGLRRDPAGRRHHAPGDPAAVRGAARPQGRRPARPAGPARPPAAAADRRRPPGLRRRGGHRRRAHARRRGHRVRSRRHHRRAPRHGTRDGVVRPDARGSRASARSPGSGAGNPGHGGVQAVRQRKDASAGSVRGRCSGADGRASRYPHAESTPRALRAVSCANVSTPSAMTCASMARAKVTMPATNASPRGVPSAWTKDLSILTTSTGNSFRRASEL